MMLAARLVVAPGPLGPGAGFPFLQASLQISAGTPGSFDPIENIRPTDAWPSPDIKDGQFAALNPTAELAESDMGSPRRFRQRHKRIRFSALRFVQGRRFSIHDE